MHYNNFLVRKKIKGKDIYIKEFEDKSKLVMTGVDFNFRKYNLKNTNKFLREHRLTDKKIAKTYQKHTKNVVAFPHPGEFYGVDGFVTDENPVMVVTADCIPILIKGNNSAALVHSGWRGVKKRIYFEAINQMHEHKSAFKIYMLPSIGKNSFQVSEDFVEEFDGRDKFNRFKTPDKEKGKYLFDLKSFVKSELIDFGIKSENIFIENVDTFTDKRFHSYRREKSEYGLNAIIYIPASIEE